jgi:hypothetical protein
MKMENYYKSPTHKLVKFFERSRDQWKEKAMEAKNKIKLCKNRIKFLETSKAALKAEVKSLKILLEEANLKNLQDKIEEGKKK